MRKRDYVPSADDNNSAPTLFAYEMQMFRGTTDRILSWIPACNDGIVFRALLEAALVHARNLLDFFMGIPSPDDDILACHVVNNYAPPSQLKYLASCRSDINKTLSHLTYSRVPRKRSWPLGRFRRAVEMAYIDFLALLPETERTKWQEQEALMTKRIEGL